MSKTYYVPVNQIKENQNIYDINLYAGYNFSNINLFKNEQSINRVKASNLDDLKLIVNYNEEKQIAKEILTNVSVPIIKVCYKDAELSNSPITCSLDSSLHKTKTINTAALYILDKSYYDEKNNLHSLTFNENSDLENMNPRDAITILETYRYLYDSENMKKMLTYLKEQGKLNARKAFYNFLEAASNEYINSKEVKTLIKKLKNHS